MTDEIPRDELESLLEQLREEVAKNRQRARKWEGVLSDQCRIKGMAMGMDIAVHEIQELIDESTRD